MLKKFENENLILYLDGRIDSTNTEIFEKELEEIFAENVEKNFYSRLSYCDFLRCC